MDEGDRNIHAEGRDALGDRSADGTATVEPQATPTAEPDAQEPPRRPVSIASLIALALICALVAFGLWKAWGPNAVRISVSEDLAAVMSTQSKVTAVVPVAETELAEAAIRAADSAIRRVQARMNIHLSHSELERLNTAPAGEMVPLSPETLGLLRRAHELHQQTRGAFDITVRPLIGAWKQAADEDRLPLPHELAEAREASNWDQLQLVEGGVVKLNDDVQVDLGGIAKGYAIDQAVLAMRTAGVRAGMVDIGGDLRVFGKPNHGEFWRIGVQDPFSDGQTKVLALLKIRDEAVCTSGNYRRGFDIDGRHYSHIIDPTTGQPADAAPSVTVVAQDALTADVWATALSVLGVDGLELLVDHPRIGAMVITGTPDAWEVHTTPGFEKYYQKAPDAPPRQTARLRPH